MGWDGYCSFQVYVSFCITIYIIIYIYIKLYVLYSYKYIVIIFLPCERAGIDGKKGEGTIHVHGYSVGEMNN